MNPLVSAVLLRKPLPTLDVFSSRCFSVSDFKLRSLILLDLIFVQCNRYVSNLIFLHVEMQFSPPCAEPLLRMTADGRVGVGSPTEPLLLNQFLCQMWFYFSLFI